MTNTERIQANNAELREAIQMAENLPDAGGVAVVEPINITENGTYAAPDGVDGYSPVTVNVPVPDGYIKPSGTKSITENGNHDVKQYEAVAVNVPIPDGYVKPTGTLNITENGEYDVTEKTGVVVAVESQGGGAEVETVIGEIGTEGVNFDDDVTLYYLDKNLNLQCLIVDYFAPNPNIEVVKNSIIFSPYGFIIDTGVVDFGEITIGRKAGCVTDDFKIMFSS